MVKIKDRIVELRRIKASELQKHPQNWRKHPEAQKAVMTEMLNKIGYAGALIGRDTPQGVQLLDGHLRADTTPNMKVPVLIVDLNDEEAKLLLATMDPIAAMAEKDSQMLKALLVEAEMFEGEFAKWASDFKEPPPINPAEISPGLSSAIQAQNLAQNAPSSAQSSGDNVQRSEVSPLANSAPPAPLQPPDDFASFDEEIPTSHECPRCHYRWS